MKFVHASDQQLGTTQRFPEFDDGKTQARFHESCLNAISRIGELATSEGAEFIVAAGGAFDSNTLPDEMFLQALGRTTKLPVSVYLLPGSHDALDASSIFRHNAFESLEDRRIYVIRDSEPISIRDGVELIGVSVRGKYSADDIVAEIATELEPADGIQVIVIHNQVGDFGADTGTTIDLTSLEQAIDHEALHYVALGDSYSTSRLDHVDRIYFSDTYETTTYDDKEQDSDNALVVEITEDNPVKGSVTVASHRVEQRAFHVIDMDITDAENLGELFAELDGIEAKTDTAMKYSLRGTMTLSESTTFEDRLEQHQQLFATLYRRRSSSDLTVVSSRGDISNLNLTGYPLVAAKKLTVLSKGRTESGSPPSESEAAAAADALCLLARLAGKRE